MKKILIALTIVISCLGISRVNAADLQLVSQTDLDKFHEVFTDEEFSNNINNLITEYKENYYYNHPYYAIKLIYYPKGLFSDYSFLIFQLYYYSELPDFKYYGGGSYGSYYGAYLGLTSSSSGIIHFEYSSLTGYNNDYVLNDSNQYSSIQFPLFYIDHNANPHRSEFYPIYYSNFDLTLTSLNKFPDNCFLAKTYDNILVPTFSDLNNYSVLSLSSDNLGYHFENLYDYDNKYNTDVFPTSYTEINLNDYAYVALALKDYNQKSFETTIQVKGNYCLTPVYNYGMTERKEIITGSKMQRCSPYYNTFTPVRTSISDSDLKNHAIYYVKAYDTSKDNYIKVDTSIFDVIYITEENKDIPYVTIGGKTYPTIPYDKLTDTATKSEEEGYNAGASCAIGDFNCMTNNSSSTTFSDIFTAPLEFLKDIWTSITSVFSLITELLSLLPPIMQNFLYASFMLAIIIGLIKIIL